MSRNYFGNIYNCYFLIQMLKFATLMLHIFIFTQSKDKSKHINFPSLPRYWKSNFPVPFLFSPFNFQKVSLCTLASDKLM
jgi:hypothetical protein